MSRWKCRFSRLKALERGGARRKRGGAPRKAIDDNNRTRDVCTTASNSNYLTPGKTFALLRATSALLYVSDKDDSFVGKAAARS